MQKVPRVIDFTNPSYDFPKMWLINPIWTSINQGYLKSPRYLFRVSNENVCQNTSKSLSPANFNVSAPIVLTLCDYPSCIILSANTRLGCEFPVR